MHEAAVLTRDRKLSYDAETSAFFYDDGCPRQSVKADARVDDP